MKLFEQLSKDIETFTHNITKELENAQRETAEKIWADVIDNAPFKKGGYVESIEISPTTNDNGTIKTFIGSSATVTSKAGKSYNLGYLLEHGTLNHAIPNAFNWGVIYGFDSERYFRTCRDDWHPGGIAIPHYKIALEKNKELYKGKIKMTFKKEVNK